MLLPIQALLARLTSAAGFTFTTNPAGDIVIAADDTFKLAALVDFAGRCADIIMCFPDRLRETVALGSEVFPANTQVAPDDTVMGQPRERVAKDLADKRAMAEQEKLVEAGRKSWVTRRANAASAKKGK